MTDPDPPTDPPPTEVQRADLEVTPRVSAADAEVAAVLPWAGGAIPGASVALRGLDETFTAEGTTGENGTVRFDDLLEGRYELVVTRILTSEERAGLAAGAADVLGFGGVAVAAVASPQTSATVQLTAGRSGSVVISEVYDPGILDASQSGYTWNNFIELHNASDTTVYLDGMLVVAGMPYSSNTVEAPCTVFDGMRLDPEGIWSPRFFQVPGDGDDFPLAAGDLVVLATDAIDHRSFIAEGLDLSHADFEFLGVGDVDNPDVPNLVSRGDLNDAHGEIFRGSVNWVPVLAAAGIDLASLADTVLLGVTWVRIPAESILDVGQFAFASAFPECDRLVNARFDRGVAAATGNDPLVSMARRRLFTQPDGRIVLQRTFTSSRDFKAELASPGTIR